MNTSIQKYYRMSVLYGTYTINFLRNCQIIFQSATTFPPVVYESSRCSAFSQHLLCVSLLILAILEVADCGLAMIC